MILFVFEGKRREPDIFKTLDYLFFSEGQSIISCFGNNIYELYRQLSELGEAGDIVSLLRDLNRDNPDSPFSKDITTSDFAEIYLFFDYDFQNKNLPLETMNAQIAEMLDLFSDETENGKLYINYPMLEAIRYTKALPDEQYVKYTVTRSDCCEQGFKDMAQHFSAYGSLDFIVLDFRSTPEANRVAWTRQNWDLLRIQNAVKANYLCNNLLCAPASKMSISQNKIFGAQLAKHILPHDEVAVLSAFPLFCFDYVKSYQ
jgi:hypothetical protein